MSTYYFPNGQCVYVVRTEQLENEDTLLHLELGTYNECYLRKPDGTRKKKQPCWFISLMGTYMPVRERDVPPEIRQAWVYCYERSYALPIDLSPYYTP